MKIKFGAIVADGRGKIGGHVASKNRSGAYMRTKVTPTNPNTIAQSEVRSLFASLSQNWRMLTPAERLAWNNAVSDWQSTDIFGDIKKPTGLNLYVKLNANLSSVSAGLLTLPAQKGETPSAYPVSATYSLATKSVTLVMSDNSGDTIDVIVRATPPVSPGVSFVKSELRVIGNYQGALGTVVASGYVAKFGDLVIDSNVFVSTQFVMSNGQKTVPVQLKMKITV